MNINLVRAIDYYLGIPLCFLVAVLNWPSAILRRFGAKIIPKKILFIELSEMGSTILADPAIRLIRKRTEAALYFLIFERNKNSLFILNTVQPDRIMTIRDDNIFKLIWDTFRFIINARRVGIDAVIDLEIFSRYSALLSQLCGAKLKIGFHAFFQHGLYRGNFLTHRVSYNPHIHISKNFMAIAHALLSEKDETPFTKAMIQDSEIRLKRFGSTMFAQKTMVSKLTELVPSWAPSRKPLIIFNVNASDLIPQRRWPQHNFAELAKYILRQNSKCVILFTGSLSETPYVRQVVDQVKNARAINIAGKVSVPDLPLLYEQAAWMLTNDSAPAHFAAVTALKSFVLYGPETPNLYGSLGNSVPIYANLACSPCVTASNHRKTACNDNVCMQVLTVPKVIQVLRDEKVIK